MSIYFRDFEKTLTLQKSKAKYTISKSSSTRAHAKQYVLDELGAVVDLSCKFDACKTSYTDMTIPA